MPAKPTRPGSITFVAIVLIILGCLSLLGGLTGAPGLIYTAVTADPPPRAPGQPPDGNEIHRMAAKENATYYPVVGGLLLVDVLFGIAQIVCGIGLLRMNPTWRIPAILVTLGKMLFSWGNQAYQVVVLGPVTTRFFQEALVMPPGPGGQPQQMPFDIGMFMQAAMGIGVFITVIVQLAIFLTITLILTSARTKVAFAAASAPQPAEDDADNREHRRPSRYEGYDDDEMPPDTGITDRPRKSPPDTGITDRS
jgi:hypothetical protein